jgi:multiple sugar transport system ATP-binding protein
MIKALQKLASVCIMGWVFRFSTGTAKETLPLLQEKTKTMARVQLEHIRKIYDNQVVAVHDASFEISDGEFVVLVGPSGCGKSTTLRMIAGLESITKGTLRIGDRVMNEVPPKDRDIAMVFQNYALYPHMTVFDNMAFGLKLRKYSREEIDKRVKQAADILGIEPILERKPKQLSGGQRQRVAVGRAIVRKPQVFLFDEPLSNLDAKLRVQMRTEISKLHRQLGATMIYVTHDQVEAMTMGDRIVVMWDGHIQQIDTPLNLYDHPVNKFVAGFIGSPAMNFVDGRIIREDGLHFRAMGNAFSVPLQGGHAENLARYEGNEMTLGIRPEDIYVAQSPYISGPVTEVDLLLDVVEPMGNEIVMYAGSLDHSLVARVKPQPVPDPGQSIRLALDLKKVHFFDPDSGETIGAEASASQAA